MRELSQDECIEIRKRLLYNFHKYCEAEKIKYSLGYGTLLGAVRHGGMIPWDDDIDVIVSRKDFERLNELNEKNDSIDQYQFVSHKNHPEIKTKIAYYIDFGTMTETAYKTNEYHGVHIDIYPVDIVPNSRFLQKKLFVERWFLQKLIRAKDIHPEVMKGANKVIRKLVLTLCSPFSYDKALDKLHNISKQYMNIPENEKKIACILVETGKPIFFPYAITQEYVKYNYDNYSYWGYKDFNCILSKWYGDYMTPPPSEERKRPEHKFVHFYSKEDD